MEVSNYLVSWVVTYLGDLQPTYIGVIIYLLSTMDIPVVFIFGHLGWILPAPPLLPTVPINLPQALQPVAGVAHYHAGDTWSCRQIVVMVESVDYYRN